MLRRPNLYRSDGKEGLEDLLFLLGLSGNTQLPSDVVFVALDFEGLQSRSSSIIYEVGISTLDSRHLNEIETKHFYVAGGNKRYMKSAKKFLYGITQHIDKASLLDILLSFFYWRDDLDASSTFEVPKFRKVVLVSHGSYAELKYLANLGIDIASISPVIAVLDTVKISHHIFGKGFTLEGLLKALGCPTKNIHTAGNDANFTLRALLLLAVQTQEIGMAQNGNRQRTSSSLQKLGHGPLPDIDEKLAEAKRSKQQHWESQDWAESLDMLNVGDGAIFECNS